MSSKTMPSWRRPCIICRRERPAVFVKRLSPFGVLAFCDGCRRLVLEALLEAGDPHSLSELFALLRAEDAERRESEKTPQETEDGATNLQQSALIPGI